MPRKPTADKHDRVPDGTRRDWDFIFAGRKMSVATIRRLERTLITDPDNHANRVYLLGYYSDRIGSEANYFRHVLWMIDNRPADYLSSSFVNHGRWTKTRVAKASEHWKRQLKKYYHDVSVVCNAAAFFEEHEPIFGVKLYKRAKKLDSKMALPARSLAYLYRSLSKRASKKEEAKLIRLALKEVEYALQRKDSLGETVGILQEFTKTAIQFGHLRQAKAFAKRFKYHYTRNSFYTFLGQYLYVYLAWIDLKERKMRGVKQKLAKLHKLFSKDPSHVACGNVTVCFLSDLIQLNEKSVTEKAFDIFIFGAREHPRFRIHPKEERDELIEWRNAFRQNRKPRLTKLKKAWIF